MAIQSLIDKQDNFEIVRDKIAQILANETASQQALATNAGKDPALWALSVFIERSNPWEQWLNDVDGDKTPIVNVWFDGSVFDPGSSNGFERQKSETTYNIDLYGCAVSSSDGSGHLPGDREAALVVQRAIKLVRNILMSAEYYKLDLRGLVWDKFIQSITQFQPQFDSPQIQNIVGARITLRVSFNEFAPQYEGVTLEEVSVDVLRAEDDSILAEADYIYPLTP